MAMRAPNSELLTKDYGYTLVLRSAHGHLITGEI